MGIDTRIFTEDELDGLQPIHDALGPRAAYRAFFNIDSLAPISTGDVEDFAVAFYTQWNSRFGTRY